MDARRWLLTAGCVIGLTAAGASGFQARPRAPAGKRTEPKTIMSPALANLQLAVVLSDGARRFLPEQAARFDLVFRSLSSREEAFASLTGNNATPTLRVFDQSGKLVGKFDPGTRRRRFSGHKKFAPAPPVLAYLQDGIQDGCQINLWDYSDPLPPGAYRLEVSHEIRPGGPSIQAAPVSFEIAPARISSAAMNYGVSDHSSSLLSWLAQPLDKSATPEILIRLSAGSDHGTLMQGAASGGHVPLGARLSATGDGWPSPRPAAWN